MLCCVARLRLCARHALRRHALHLVQQLSLAERSVDDRNSLRGLNVPVLLARRGRRVQLIRGIVHEPDDHGEGSLENHNPPLPPLVQPGAGRHVHRHSQEHSQK
eukprot:scaffold10670_cov142-Isochrysis_galbana.AAC.4